VLREIGWNVRLAGQGDDIVVDEGACTLPLEGQGDAFAIRVDVAGSQFGAADLAAGAVFAYGNRSVFVSIDRGGSWQRVKTPKRRSIADLDFVTERVGYLLDTRGALWKTTKRGRSWRPVTGVGAAGSAVEFSSGRNGYVVVRGFGSLREAGFVMRTTDGGQSWHPQLVSRFFIASLESTGSIDYALANGSALYATGVGGDDTLWGHGGARCRATGRAPAGWLTMSATPCPGARRAA
jgi:photosystem II stability/assembly factor-like uncharacterized protein